MSEQDNAPAPTQGWTISIEQILQKEYWKERGQPWRTELEIDTERQKYLEERRRDGFKDRKYFFPLNDVSLSRADIEWLLATHENGRGPVDRNDSNQRERKGLGLQGADLRGVDLSELPLAGSNLSNAHLERAEMSDAHLEGTALFRAYLTEANLDRAHLEGAVLMDAHLEGASLHAVHLEGAKIMGAYLEGANLASCYLDTETDLHNIRLFDQKRGGAVLVDVRWRDANLAVVDWSALAILGDERAAARARTTHKTPDYKLYRIEFSNRAARAYRQLSIVLRNQGLNEEAARFAYRAQRMQRKVLWYQNKFGQYFLSLFMDLLAGYGYKPWRSFFSYLIVIVMFAVSYFFIGRAVGPVLSPLGAYVFSMTSFHGRGFFPGGIGLDDPLTVVAAFEAFIGLLIEVTFIATLTQRLFGK